MSAYAAERIRSHHELQAIGRKNGNLGTATPLPADRECTSRSGFTLSSRESEVLQWLAHGKSGIEIAIILGISTCTVRIHIQSVKRKLNAATIPHAVYLAATTGLLRL